MRKSSFCTVKAHRAVVVCVEGLEHPLGDGLVLHTEALHTGAEDLVCHSAAAKSIILNTKLLVL